MMFHIGNFKRQAGFTMVEVVIYIGLLALITSVSSIFLLGILRADALARSEQATFANITFALQALEREVRHAEVVYVPTSVFSNDAGQLSLRTPKDASTDHIVSYTDIYLDNGVIYLRRDDTLGTVPLTSADVDVTVLRFERYVSGEAEGILTTIVAAPEGFADAISAPRTVSTFVSARIVEPQ